ncbi:MAG: APC family permease [Actinomycetia bacterium]|nr:APC family permease [Actinomycetes bacterium]
MSTDVNRLAQGQLSTLDCVAQSLAVGPVFSGALLGGILAGLSGGVGPFVIVVTVIGVLGLGRVVSEFAKRYSGTGTVYEFIARSLGQRAAVFAAGVYHLAATALAGPGIAIIGGLLARDFFNAHMGIDWPWWVWALIVTAIILEVNVVGVKISMKAQLALIAASVLPFVILFFKVLLDGPTDNSIDSFNPSNVAEGGSLFKGLLFAILMFVGFELSAALGEETKNPKHSIPRAVLMTIGITGAFYIMTQYTLAIGGGLDFAPLAEAELSRFFGIWIELAVILDILAVGIGFQLAAARGVFSMARDGVLPKALARTNAKQLPIAGSIAVCAVAVVTTLIALAKYGTDLIDPTGPDFAFNSKVFFGFLGTTVIGGMLICLVYLLVCLGALKLFATKNPLDLGGAILGLATCAGGIAAQFIEGTKPAPDYEWGRTFGIVIAILVAIWAAVAKKDVVAKVAQHATEH